MPMIPFNDLARLIQGQHSALSEASERVLSRAYFILGPESKAFEEEFAQYCGVRYCVTLANGTDAIELALRAVGVSSGDLVATVANAGGYSTTAINAIHAVPVYIDIDASTMLISAEHLQEVSKQLPLKAVVVTHLYGLLANMPKLVDIARSRGIALVEDCAQSHGATRDGKKAGSFGDIAAFSFYPTKNLGALGDGGAVVTQQESLADIVRELRQYGWKTKYRRVRIGGRNSRLDEMQAAMLRALLPTLPERNNRRHSIIQRYHQGLRTTPLQLPHVDQSHVGHLYVIRHPERDRIRSHLQVQGIGTDIHYPIPDHCQPGAVHRFLETTALRITEKSANELLSLPCFPELSDDEVDSVIAAVHSAFHNIH